MNDLDQQRMVNILKGFVRYSEQDAWRRQVEDTAYEATAGNVSHYETMVEEARTLLESVGELEPRLRGVWPTVSDDKDAIPF